MEIQIVQISNMNPLGNMNSYWEMKKTEKSNGYAI